MRRRSVLRFQTRREYIAPLNPDPDDIPSLDVERLWAELFGIGPTLARDDLHHVERRLLTRRVAAIAAALAQRRRRQRS
jgi:hypothetical protein